MKNLIVILLLSEALSNCILAQNTDTKIDKTKIKTLSIVYDITYPSQKPKVKSACFNKAILLLHGSTSFIKTFTEYDDVSTSLTYNCNETILASLSTLPNVLIKSDKNLSKRAFESAKIPLPKISITSETKEILGYNCKKVLTEQNIGSNITKSYSYIFEGANNLYCFNDFAFEGGIKGLMLGKEVDFSDGAIQVWTATSIKEEMIDSSVFTVPSNYEVMTQEGFTQKLMKDKSLQKKMTELTPDAKKQIRKETWNDLAMTLIQSVTQASQQIMAAQEFQKNPNSQTLNNYAAIVTNNVMKDPNEAIKANNQIVNTITYNTSESSASTNGGSSTNSQQAAICAKKAKTEWEKSKEYINYMNNQSCNKMAYIAQRKQAEILRDSCAYCSSEADKEVLRKTISSLTSQINSMPDCQIINFEPGKSQKTNITIVPSTTPEKNNNNGSGAIKAQ